MTPFSLDRAEGGRTRVFLHVGLSKTGTTHLQERLFARHGQILNLGKPDFARIPELAKLNISIQTADDDEFDAVAAQSTVRSALAAAERQDSSIVWSEENFTNRSTTIARTAERLHAILPDAEVLITIREQRSFVESLLFVSLNKGQIEGARSLDRACDDWLESEWRQHETGADNCFDRLDYAGLVERYELMFGADRVSVLCFEQLRAEPQSFVERLSGLLQIDPAEAWSCVDADIRPERQRASMLRYRLQDIRRRHPAIGALWRRLPPSLRSLVSREIDRGPRASAQLPPRWQAKIADIARAGNRRLDARFSLGLAAYGYEL